MKKLSKVLALVLAFALVLGLTVSASAASITINRDSSADEGTTSGTVFTYYEILKADLSALDSTDYDDNGAPKSDAKVIYYVDKQALATALAALTTGDPAAPIFTVTQVGTSTRWNVELAATGISGADLAEALNVTAVTSNAEANGTKTLTGASVTISDLDPGYYLITASNGTALVAQTLADVTINEKNQYPTGDKEITGVNGSSITATDSTDINIGDTVTYSVPVVIPANVAAKDIVVTDKMYKGLTLSTSSLTAVTNDSTPVTITGLSFSAATVDGDYNIYTVTIPAATVTANAGKTITLTYTATLNADAIIGGDNTNSAKLTFDNYTSTDNTTTVKTFKFELDKTDGSNKLDGVKFTLSRDNSGTTEYYQGKSGTNSVWGTTVKEFTTDGTNTLVFDGLDAGVYTLSETDTPSGFNPLTGDITVTIAADGSVTYTSTDPHNTATNATASDGVITVVNNAGATLPSTGGIGTTIFYIVGSLLVIGAGVLLVTRKRMTVQ